MQLLTDLGQNNELVFQGVQHLLSTEGEKISMIILSYD